MYGLKFLWGLLVNIDLILQGLLMLGLILCVTPWKEWGKRCVIIVLIPFLILSLTPMGRWMVTSLENRFEQLGDLPPDVVGLILLGGSFALEETKIKNRPVYNKAAARLFEFIELAHKYPNLKILVTGTPLEIKFTKEILKRHGIDVKRIIFEDQSSNTRDNAYNSYTLIQPHNERWALVTSAFHMPRAVGLFRGAGWNILPYPVDYQTSGNYGFTTWISGLDRLNILAFSTAIRQWAGLINHYLEGDSKELYPQE